MEKSNSQFLLYSIVRISQRINQIFEILGLYCFAFNIFSNRQNFYTTQLFTQQDWNCVNVFSNKNIRTANFNPEFTGY